MHLQFKACDHDEKGALAVSEEGVFSGYGAIFGNVDSHAEVIVPGAFKATLAQHKSAGSLPFMLFNHDPTRPVGEYTAMSEDDRGLKVTGRLWVDGKHPDPDAIKVHRQMKAAGRGMGLSIGYMLKGSKMRPSGVRELHEIDLREVSAVMFPSNDLARTTAVKAEGLTIRDFERALREILGFSRQAAEEITLNGFKAFASRRDARDALAAGDPDALEKALQPRDEAKERAEIAALLGEQIATFART